MKLQRLRLTFAREEELKYISHLDLMRLWSRALRRAGLPLAYSEGFSPHPSLSLAAPLAIGVTSEAELLEIYLERRLSPYLVMKAVSRQLPNGITLKEIQEIGLALPSLQSQVRATEYRVEVEADREASEVERQLSAFLELGQLPWEHLRDGQVRSYDLRALVEDLWLVGKRGSCYVLGMKLRNDSSGAGRPEQVTAALGLPAPSSIHRTRLFLAAPGPTYHPRRYALGRGERG